MNPQVSIIMPVYNGEKYIKETIESILSQTFKDFEFIIIDDHSTDNSVNIISSFKDPRIKLSVNEKNLGLSNTLNLAIENSKAKYIARMDHDDISLPNRIEEQFNFMEQNPEIGACGTYIKMFGFGEPRIKKFPLKGSDIKAELLLHSPMAHPTVMFRKEVLKKYDLKYNSEYDGAEDYDLWERMNTVTIMANIPKILLNYRLHESQLSRISPTKKAKVEKIQRRIYERMRVGRDDLLGIFLANIKLHSYSNISLLKVICRIYYANAKIFIKRMLKWEN